MTCHHFLFQDHQCAGIATPANAAAAAALSRLGGGGGGGQQSKQSTSSTSSNSSSFFGPFRRSTPAAATTRTTTADVQGQLSEDEAMARALQASLNVEAGASSVNHEPMSQEEIDRLTALALQESINAGEQGGIHQTQAKF
jgi:hypothetical protein